MTKDSFKYWWKFSIQSLQWLEIPWWLEPRTASAEGTSLGQLRSCMAYNGGKKAFSNQIFQFSVSQFLLLNLLLYENYNKQK